MTKDIPQVGTLTWKMGLYWWILPPNKDGTYSSKKVYRSSTPLGCITKDASGRGSGRHTLQVIGSIPITINLTINLGWATIHLAAKNSQPTITFSGGKSAAVDRWARTRTGELPPRRKRRQTPIYPHQLKQQSLNPNISAMVEREVLSQSKKDLFRSEIYIRDRGICWICNNFVLLRDYELGHIIDRTNGGTDTFDNCAVMHKWCNASKPRHNTLEEALKWRLSPKL